MYICEIISLHTPRASSSQALLRFVETTDRAARGNFPSEIPFGDGREFANAILARDYSQKIEERSRRDIINKVFLKIITVTRGNI